MPLVRTLSLVATFLVCLISGARAAGHRDAPAMALDPAADVTDVFAFRSYDAAPLPRVTLIMSVHPFLDPGSGTLDTPFDPTVLYQIHIDNNDDALADLTFQFRFTTEIRAPASTTGLAGAGSGIVAPANSPPPVAPGTDVVSPHITTFDDPGLAVRQSYTVTLLKGKKATPFATGTFYAVPGNLGPRTMDYAALFAAGVYDLGNGVHAFAGTTDDAFFADLAGLSDTLNVRSVLAPGVLSPSQDASQTNVASDTLSGYAVNSIAIEVPVAMLTATGAVESPMSAAATIGVWGTTSRFPSVKHPPPKTLPKKPRFKQVDRMGNPFVDGWLVGLGSKDAFSIATPAKDATFATFLFDPAPARILNAATGGAVAIPAPPRGDLALLFTYTPPLAAPGTPSGPTADLLRLNTGVAPTSPGSAIRLGLLGGDAAGFPNGRRLFDDVTDIMLRYLAGVAAPGFNISPNNRLGDGVNVNDAPFRTTFPYLANAPSGRDRRHLDPGEGGCTAGGGAACAF